MNDFCKIMGELRIIYDRDPINLPNIFWNTIDNIPNDTVFTWCERMLEVPRLVLGQDYIRTTGIQFHYRQHKMYTTKQKRRLMIDLVSHWYDVEFRYELG